MKSQIAGLIFCMLIISVVSSSAIDFNVTSKDDEKKLMLVRIDINQNLENLPKDIEIVGSKINEWVEIILSEDRIDELSFLNIKFEVQIWDVEEYYASIRGSYHSLAQINSIIQNIANTYPSITSLYSLGTTYQGRDIWCLEITDNPGVDEGEPGVFFMGLHHAREWPTVEICLNIANQLTSNYGSDPTITDLVNNRRIWIVTCVNPDGYYYCYDQGNDWRKNRKPYSGGIGVDLNRNYAGSSNGDPWGSWGSVGTGSISNYPSSEVYCGPSPFSEAETQAVRDMFLQHDIHASISYHTYGELVMWPWGYTPSYAPDRDYLMQIGQQIAQRITKQSGTGTYTPQQSCGLYPTTGDTTDWSYGYSHYVQGLPAFVYTIEACSSFHPSATYLDQIVAENFDGALYLLEEAENIRDTVTPRVVPPIIDEMETDLDGDYTVSWQVKNPASNPSKFHLDELTGPSIGIDNAESTTAHWELNGFSLSTTRYHSSSHSYKSGSGNNQVYTMTSVDPIYVTSGMNLEFWCWYNLETNYDMTFVEVSTDGRNYNMLGSFTGSSSTWIQKQYSLEDYVGKSIFIRFRYVTDDYTLLEGFYVDDISPVVDWDSITTLSNLITDTYYDIYDKEDGTYYYRVKGYNSEREWGDFSTLEKIYVNLIENDPPQKPTINGPATGKPGQQYIYTFSALDPDEDNIYLYINWGDGNIEEWIGPYASGEIVSIPHTWDTKGNYQLKAKAKDIYDQESDWEVLDVKIPRSKVIFLNILEKFPKMFEVFRFLLKFA
jgi:carboxypeptidase T